MDKADDDDSTVAADALPAYLTTTEAITLLARRETVTLAVLNAEREAFVAAVMEAQAAPGTALKARGELRRAQLREEWAECDGQGARMAAAVALLMHELRSEKMKVWGTVDDDPAGLSRIVPLEFLLLPVTINNDAFEPDPAASMRDFTKARQLPNGKPRPMYCDLRFKMTDVLRLCRRKLAKPRRRFVPDDTLDARLRDYLSAELARRGRPAKREDAISTLMSATECTQVAARSAMKRAPEDLRNPARRPTKLSGN